MSLSNDDLRAGLQRRVAAAARPDLAAAARLIAATPRPPQQQPGRVRLLAFGSAAASVAVALALVGSLALRGEAPASDHPSPPTPSGPGRTEGSTATVEPWAELVWRSADSGPFDLAGNTFVQDALSTGDGYLAVGNTVVGDEATGRIWLSEDGTAWRLLRGDWFADVRFDHVVRVADGFLIVGLHLQPGGPGSVDPPQPGIWWSRDGEAWEERPAPELEALSLGTAAAGPLGLLILANDINGDAVWLRSDPGLQWTKSDAAWNADVRIISLAAGGPGWIAVGATGIDTGTGPEPGRSSSGAIWTSADGITWRPTTVGAPGGSISRVVRVGGGLLASGSDADISCTVCLGPIGPLLPTVTWFSLDGTTWNRAAELEPGAGFRLGPAMIASEATRSRALAFDASDSGRLRVRETVDGLAWHEVINLFTVLVDGADVVGGPYFDSVAVGRESVIAFDYRELNTEEVSPVPWFGSPLTSPEPGAATLLPIPAPSYMDTTCPNQEPCGP